MDWVPEAYRKNIDLGFEGAEEHVMISGDAMRLTELDQQPRRQRGALQPRRRPGHRARRRRNRPAACRSATTGPSIPVEERERVFERFHRLLGTSVDGSGLGLAIVREIATLHDAEISLEDDRRRRRQHVHRAFPRRGPPA